jgi:hypothetical protein
MQHLGVVNCKKKFEYPMEELFKVVEPFIQASSDLNSSYSGSKILSSMEMVQTYEIRHSSDVTAS